jgi:hypothetical protein
MLCFQQNNFSVFQMYMECGCLPFLQNAMRCIALRGYTLGIIAQLPLKLCSGFF